MVRRCGSTSLFLFFFGSVLAQLELDQDPILDRYCGFNWLEANTYCRSPCPSGNNADCPLNPSGRTQKCFQGSGCFNRMQTLYWTGVVAIMFEATEHMANYQVISTTTTSTVVASGADDEETTAAANVVPTAALMGNVEEVALETILIAKLQTALEDQMFLVSVETQNQDYDRPCVEAVFPPGWDRDDPSKITLDVTMSIITRYIPNSIAVYTNEDLGTIVKTALEVTQDAIIRELKTANPFFNAMTGIAAVSEDDLPESPSTMPSFPPTRDFDQLFETPLDPNPTGSNGIVFSVKTPKGAPSVLLVGMKFITNFEGVFEYEVYTKLGSWTGFVGKSTEFDLIASGQVTGKGSKTWVEIIQGDHVGTIVEGNETISVNYVGWKDVHVLGDGGERSFYLTTTKRFLQQDMTTIPILFSAPINGESETLRQYEIVESNSELEVYEGDGVLDYPWPTDSNGKSPYYRRPRGPIIAFNYDRAPCNPNVNFTGWPCPYVQKTRIPTRNPTKRPTPVPTTPQPTDNPKRQPTIEPTLVVTSNATETIANATFDNLQSEESKGQDDVESGAAVTIACKSYNALLGLMSLIL